MRKVFSWIKSHKLITAVIVIVLVVSGYFGYKKWFGAETTVKYVTAKVERDNLISSISGTGQVAASSQINLNTKASGDVIAINAKVGDEVKAGKVLVSLNASDALKSLRDAESNLEVAKLSLKKLEEPTDALTLMQAQHSLVNAEESKKQAEDDLKKAYEDGFNSVSNSFLALPSLMTGLDNILYGNDLESNQANLDWYLDHALNVNYDKYYNKMNQYHDDVESSYRVALESYQKSLANYKSSSRNSSTNIIENLIIETYETDKLIAEATKDAKNYLDLFEEVYESVDLSSMLPSLLSQQQSTLESYTGTTNSHLSSLLSIKSTIENSKSSLISADRTIAEKTETLKNVEAGTDELDLMSARLSVRQKENALQDARENLADYSVRAPFDGVIAAFTAKKGDTLSSGSSIGTIITKQMTATIALNEVDAAKVKVGQKVNITFDAIEDLNVTGEVAEVDTIGTVSSGVVSYNVKIVFDFQDERVKSGMTATAVIITSSKPDVLLIKTSAIKTQAGTNYVEVLVNGIPEKKTVTIGDSNDTMTEIIEGLSEGDEVITQTISSASKTTAASTSKTSTANNKSFSGGGMGLPPM